MDNAWRQKEAGRMAALNQLNVLDSPPDAEIDHITEVAALICETPIALVSLVDTDRQWFKAAIGLQASETPREHSFCSHAIEEPDRIMVIEDATKDSRFESNPLVTGDPNIRFYAGKPLITSDDHALGTLCVIDDKPRQLTETQAKALSHLAEVVVSLLRRQEQSSVAAISLAAEQALQHGIIITDPSKTDNPIVYCNKAFESITGYDHDEIIGRNCRFLQGENTDPLAIAKLREAITESHSVVVAMLNYRKDGSEFWHEMTVSPIVDKSGVTTHFIGIHQDVSQRYNIEAKLSQSRALLESAPDAMIVSNRHGEIVLANTQAVKLFGYTHEELGQMSVDSLMAERYRKAHQNARKGYFDSLDAHRVDSLEPPRSNLDFEMFFGLTKSNQEIPVDARLSPVVTDNEILVSASIRDVSNKLEAAAKLRTSEERYRELFENSSDLIQSVNSDGSFSYVNPAWLNALGYTSEELSQITIFDTVCPSNLEHCQNLFDQILQGQSLPHVAVVGITKHGKQLYLEGGVTTSVIDGEVSAIRTIFHDVTERNEHQRQLLVSKEAAENATAAKSRFLAAASHDLRQPLQSASMYIATLARQLNMPNEAEELCAMVGKSLKVMGEQLDVLLDITQLDSGSITPEKKNVLIRPMLENIFISTQQQASLKGLKFSCEYQDNTVYTDPTFLERIIENFVSNAIRYTDVGEVVLKCDTRGDKLLIAVSDTGVGIPLEKQAFVFEEYYQVGNQERDRSKGLGLGLSIVRRLAGLLDHPLEVSSELGKGSVFSILVPLGNASLLDAQVSDKAAIKGESKKPVILLVDDDEGVLKSTERLLNAHQMIVHSALNGDDALSKISNGLIPDFLLSDFRLPRYDGIELVQRIRANLSSDIPTALMTGDTSTPKIKQAKLSNFTVLHKPIDLPRLLKLISDSVE